MEKPVQYIGKYYFIPANDKLDIRPHVQYQSSPEEETSGIVAHSYQTKCHLSNAF